MGDVKDVSNADTTSTAEKQEFGVGKRLLALRQQMGLSQREVARRANMTNGNLSLIEQGKVSPSVQSLEKVLQGLGVALSEFFSLDATVGGPVIALNDFLHIRKGGAQYWVKQLEGVGTEDHSIAREVIPPKTTVSSEWMIRKGVAIGIVVEGTLTLSLDGNEHIIGKGEGYQLGLSRSFRYINNTDFPLTMVTVVIS